MYKNPAHEQFCTLSPEQMQDDFDLFYEDVFMELAKFGEVEEMIVCDNIGDHLVGNVYCQYRYEESAGNAVDSLNNRFYAGKILNIYIERERGRVKMELKDIKINRYRLIHSFQKKIYIFI